MKTKEQRKRLREQKKIIRRIEKLEESNKTGMVEKPGVSGRVADAFVIVFLLGVIAVSIVPLWHVIMASVSDGKALLSHSGMVWLPLGDKINWGGYDLIFKQQGILSGYVNTIIYVIGGTALGLIMNIMAGYILSRETKFRSFMLLFFLFTTMFNGGTVPTYMVIRSLGMTGTRLALLIPGATNAVFMLLVMNAFSAVDKSYVEAARIDGAGHFDIMLKVMLPQCKGMVMVTAINTAIMKWNAWFEASIYVPTQKEYWPLQLWIKQMTASTNDFLKSLNPDYNNNLIQYGVIVIASAPLLLALPFFIKKLEKGMVLGGVKG